MSDHSVFSWAELPPSLTAKLAKELAVASGGVPATVLADAFGEPPGEQFVQKAWPVLREAWLAHRPESRAAVIRRLASAGLGDKSQPRRSAEAQLAYLRTCRNSGRLRMIVLDEFLLFGATGDGRPDHIRGHQPATEQGGLDAKSLASMVSDLGVGEVLTVRPDGEESAVMLEFAATPTGTIETRVHEGTDVATRWRKADEVGRHLVADITQHLLDRAHAATFPAPVLQVIDATSRIRNPGHVTGSVAVSEDGIADRFDIPLRDQVMAFLAMRLGVPASEIAVDGDGDVPFQSGSAAFFLRVVDAPPTLHLFAPLLSDVSPSLSLYRRLNELSRRSLMTFTELEGFVTAAITLPGQPFIGQHLNMAIGLIYAVVDDLDDDLRAQFGGRRFIGNDPKPVARGLGMAEGGYL